MGRLVHAEVTNGSFFGLSAKKLQKRLRTGPEDEDKNVFLYFWKNVK